MNEKLEPKSEIELTTETLLTDLGVNEGQADQVKGGPRPKSIRIVDLQSSIVADGDGE